MALVGPSPLVCGRLQWRGRGGVASLAASAWRSIECYASCTFVCTSASQLLSNVRVSVVRVSCAPVAQSGVMSDRVALTRVRFACPVSG